MNSSAIKLQATIKMWLTRRRMRQTYHRRRFTPEDFFRSINTRQAQSLPTDRFIQILLDKQIFTSRSQAQRLASLIDEDFSGSITLEELQKTLKAYHYNCEPPLSKQDLSIEQSCIIKVIMMMDSKGVSPLELFSAIDVDGNQSLSVTEIFKFISQFLNDGSAIDKQIMDKEIMIFMNYMDVDRNGTISKPEFIEQYQRLKKIQIKYQDAYLKQDATKQQKKEQDSSQLEGNQSIEEAQIRQIVQKMQNEGINFEYFINHLNVVGGENDGTIRLGPLLKQAQMSYPTMPIDSIRTLLKWIPMSQGKYRILDLQIFIGRFTDDSFQQRSLFQTLTVISHILRTKTITPDTFINDKFKTMTDNIGFEAFNQAMSLSFQLPQECIIEVYNSLLVDQGQVEVKKSDMLQVLNSFYYNTDKISLENIHMYISNYDTLQPARRKALVTNLVLEKMQEKKLQAMNIYKLACPTGDIITQTQINQGFTKLIPLFSQDLINFIFPNEKYTKEQFCDILNPQQLERFKQSAKGQEKQNYINLLDDALLALKMSPALLFKQADINNNKKIDIMELKEVLLGLQRQMSNNGQTLALDDNAIREIISELDTNGNGQLEEQEFFNLIKMSRQASNPAVTQNANSKDAIDLSLTNRLDLLPTKTNLLKIQSAVGNQTNVNEKSTILSEDLVQVFKQIEQITSIKQAVNSIPISPKLTVKLRNLSQVLKSKGVTVNLLVQLYQKIDTTYSGILHLQSFLQLLNEFYVQIDQPLTCTVELNLICKIINMTPKCLGSVSDYFILNSDPRRLGDPDKVLNKDLMDREFQRLFKLQPMVNNHIYESVKAKFQYGLESLLNKHLFLYIQQIYDSNYAQDAQVSKVKLEQQPLISKDMNQEETYQQKSQSKGSVTNTNDSQNLIRKLILQAQAHQNGAISLKDILAKNGFPLDKTQMTQPDFENLFTKQNQFLTQEESQSLFSNLAQSMGTAQYTVQINQRQQAFKLDAIEFVNFIIKLEPQLVQREIKEITTKMEQSKVDFHDLILRSLVFVQEGLLSKGTMQQQLSKVYGQGKAVEDYEIRFILNQIDKDNNKTLEIDEVQEYLKLYSQPKQISMKVYFKYFAFKLETQHPKMQIQLVLTYDKAALQKISPESSKQFVHFITQNFQHARKQGLLQDLYDLMAAQISDTNFDSVISYFYAQVDQFRDSIPQSSKYIMRKNENLRNDIVNEFLRQRPTFPIYKIMEDLQFSDDQGSQIPSLALKIHLKKLYPYVSEEKLKMFVSLVDINGDQRIEIQEIFRFFNELYGDEMSYRQVLQRIGMIIYSTKETIESFFLIHQVDLKKIQTQLTFSQFVQVLVQIFRISKYEAYIIFNELKVAQSNTLDFRAFIDCLNGELKRIELTDNDNSEESKSLEAKIEAQKAKIADAMKLKLQKMMSLQSQDKQQQSQQQQQQQQSESKNKLGNTDIMKLFLDNYKELNNIQLIKRACLNFQKVIRSSSIIRAQLLTKRACDAQAMYHQLSRKDLYDDEVETDVQNKQPQIFLYEQEKIVLIVIALESVTMVFECNIFRFTKMIKRLKDTSTVDFEMLHKILEQRYKQIQDLLYEEKIRSAASANPKAELQFKDQTQIQELLTVLNSVFNLVFRPKEIVLLSRELKITPESHNIAFSTLKMFMAQCGIQIKQKESLNLIFYTLEQAKLGLQSITNYLKLHPYLKINDGLIKSPELTPSIEWMQTSKQPMIQTISPLHKNPMIIDCIQQMNSDQNEQSDQIQGLIALDDQVTGYMIVKVQQHYVIIDKALPFSYKDQTNPVPLFSYESTQPLISYVEKAMATYLGSYESLAQLKSLQQVFQMLNYDQVDLYKVKDAKTGFTQSFQDLYDNYFQRNNIRTSYFKLPQPLKKKAQNPLTLGLEPNRIYSIIAMMQLKPDPKTTHNLVVVFNPYITEDPRKNGEMWSKGFLANTKRNKKYIDLMNEQYDPSVYQFISDKTNNVYTYEFKDVFENLETEYDLLLMFKLDKTQNFVKDEFTLNFDQETQANLMTLQQKQVQDNQVQQQQSYFGLLQISLENLVNYTFMLTLKIDQDIQVYQFDNSSYGSTFSKAVFVPQGQKLIAKLSLSSKQQLNDSMTIEPFEQLVNLYYLKDQPLTLVTSELKEEVKSNILPKDNKNNVKDSVSTSKDKQQSALPAKQEVKFINTTKEEMKSNHNSEEQKQQPSYQSQTQINKDTVVNKQPPNTVTKIKSDGITTNTQSQEVKKQVKEEKKLDKKVVEEVDEYYDEEYDDEEEKKLQTVKKPHYIKSQERQEKYQNDKVQVKNDDKSKVKEESKSQDVKIKVLEPEKVKAGSGKQLNQTEQQKDSTQIKDSKSKSEVVKEETKTTKIEQPSIIPTQTKNIVEEAKLKDNPKQIQHPIQKQPSNPDTKTQPVVKTQSTSKDSQPQPMTSVPDQKAQQPQVKEEKKL